MLQFSPGFWKRLVKASNHKNVYTIMATSHSHMLKAFSLAAEDNFQWTSDTNWQIFCGQKRGQQTVKVISSDLHVKENVFVDQVLPFAHADKVVVDAFQFCCSHLQQEVGEFLLPFLTVSEEGQLQWIAVQKHKLDIQYCLVHLYVVCNFCVPVRCSMLKLTT